MDASNAEFEDKADFHAILTPHRSLGRQGFVLLMATLATSWLVTGLFFLSKGAWPIFGFFGLDVLAIYVAFKLNYRSARQHEEVRLTRQELLIAKVTPKGERREMRFNPFWTKFDIARHPLIGVTDMRVISRQRFVRIGDFLNPEDKTSFADAFQRALATVRSR